MSVFNVVRYSSYAAPFLFWFAMCVLLGASGLYMGVCVLCAIVGGFYLGYYVVTHGITIGHIPVRRAWGAFFLCVVLPLFFFLGTSRVGATSSTAKTPDKVGSVASRSSMENDKSDKTRLARMPIESDETPDETLGMTKRNLEKTALGAYTRGENEGPGGSAIVVTHGVHGSVRRDPVVVKTGDGSWEVKFHMPGPMVIETEFPLPLGKVYYVSTNGLVENLKVGRVAITESGNGRIVKQFSFVPAPASVFCEDKPFLARQIANVPGARLAFSTELVPPGDYTIKIVEPLFLPARDEHSPGVPLDKWYQ